MFTGTKMPVFASQRVDGKHVKKYVARKTISRNSVPGLTILAALLRLTPSSEALPWSAETILATPVAAATTSLASPSNRATKTRTVKAFGKLPLSFEANRGQTDPSVKFLSRGDEYSLFLTPTEAVVALRPQVASRGEEKQKSASEPQSPVVLRMGLVNANPETKVTGQDPLPGKSNYFVGNDPKNWQTDVPTYAKVQYKEVYSGIDLIYYGNQSQLEYDFVVAPGADPKAIRLSFAGADKVEASPEGDLVLHTPAGEIRQHKPFIYQDVDGVKQPVAGRYVVQDFQSSELPPASCLLPTCSIGFHVAAYDPTMPLVIDPILTYATYLGGSNDEEAKGISVDTAGNMLVTGRTLSTNFPVANAVDGALTGSNYDGFVTKVSADGATLLYSTYLGGSGFEEADAIAVDSNGNAYITGTTGSSGFPVTVGAFQTQSRGAPDAFVTKFDPQGRIVYSTFLGGPSPGNTIFTDEEGLGIAVDVNGNAYVTGLTSSLTFPITPTAFQASGGSGGGPRLGFDAFDAFLSVLNADGTALLYSSYLAGNGIDYGDGIAIDQAGHALITGKTLSINFPTRNAFQPIYGGTGQAFSLGTPGDAFIVKIDPFQERDASFIYGSYLGGDRIDVGFAVAVDDIGNAYVTGQTFTGQDRTVKFPTTEGAFRRAETTPSAPYNFVTKVNPSGALVYSTLTGEVRRDVFVGNGISFFHTVRGGIAVDPSGNAWLTGAGLSSFPQVDPIQPSFGGSAYDVFVAQLDATGSALLFSTFLGGNSVERGEGIALDAEGNVYVAGAVTSLNFPTTPNAIQPGRGDTNISFSDALVFKLSPTPQVLADLMLTKSDAPDPVLVGRNLTYTLTATNLGPDTATDVRIRDSLPTGAILVSASAGCTGSSTTVTCSLGTLAVGASTAVTLLVTPSVGGQITNTAQVFSNEFDPIPNNNFATAMTTVDASTDLALSITDSPDPLTSTPDTVSSSRQTLTYTLTITNNGPSPATGITVTDTLPANVAYVSYFTASGLCQPTTGVVTCSIPGPLAPNASALVFITVKPIATGQINNTATATGAQTDLNPSNNTATAVTTNNAVFADLGVSVTATPKAVKTGRKITYTLKVTNTGPMDAPDVIVTEGGFTPGNNFVSVTANRGTCTGTTVATCQLGALAKGKSATVKIVRVPTVLGVVQGGGVVRGSVHDLNSSNDSDSVFTTVNP